MGKITKTLTRIPEPRRIPIMGNLHLMDTTAPIQSIEKIAKDFGGIWRLTILKNNLVIITSQELVNEICDESRFDKKISRPLEIMRAIVGDGLFTAKTTEPNWGKAHRILMSAFGPTSLRGMVPGMLDIVEQMLLKWERLGDGHSVDITDNMTRLTLDTIALTGFGFRFNSFYEKAMHPFVDAMIRGLGESSLRARRPAIGTKLKFQTARQYEEDMRYLHQVADQLVAERKANPNKDKLKDLLSIMLEAKDPVTDEGLDDANIRNQMVTFLIAGHETTSGMLSFALHAVLKNPEILRKAREEIDRVLGTDTPRFEDVAKLGYLDQILKETLRIWPTAPAFAVQSSHEDTVIGGQYEVKKNETLMIIAPLLHRDPKVWKDPELFNPDRMAPELFNALPPNAWKPFGNGQRGCIGRAFAMQEAILVLAMTLQRFDLELADPNYKLKVKETLTLKPEGLFVRFRKRESYRQKVSRGGFEGLKAQATSVAGSKLEKSLPLTILFGSNSGSSEAFAQRIAGDAASQGYAVKVDKLDAATGKLESGGALVIVTASYEGQPPDNARSFVSWLEKAPAQSLVGVRYVVFGCGNKDWSRTYQAVPTKLDQLMEQAGATRVMARGEADARGDFFGDFDRWYEGFWPAVGKALGQELKSVSGSSDLEIDFVEGTESHVLNNHQLQLGLILENRELVAMSHPLARSKRHIELQLAPGTSYQAGDYLALLPKNPPETIARVLKRFGLEATTLLKLRSSAGLQTMLPLDRTLSLEDILANYVELARAATRVQIQKLADLCPCPPEKQALIGLIQDDSTYTNEIFEKRVSVLDLLERHISCNLSLAAFLTMLPSLKPRQYSISSAPLWAKDRCTLTVAVVEGEAWSGSGPHFGVASRFLAMSRVGSSVGIMPMASNQAFHLPQDARLPIVLACAGTGLAPFRGFLQERAILKAQGNEVGEAILYFGCDHPEVDYLYRSELEAWEEQGVVRLRPAFSEVPGQSIRYVQDRIWQDRHEVMEMYDRGAKFYVCGDGRRMAPAVKETFGRIYKDSRQVSQAEADHWFSELEKNTRYVADVFS